MLVVTESVFSMDGDHAPLREMVGLKEQYGAWLMVDEAHATGLYGAHRRGLAEELGVSDRIEIQMGTLGKALGASGGYICGSRALIDYLINRARTFIFSTAPVPAAAAAATAGRPLRPIERGRGTPEQIVAARLHSPLHYQPSTINQQERHHPDPAWRGKQSGCSRRRAARAGHFHPRDPLSDRGARPGPPAPDAERRPHAQLISPNCSPRLSALDFRL